MPHKHTLEDAERAARERVEHLPLDVASAHALSSLFRAAQAVRTHLTREVLRPHNLTWRSFLVLWTLWIWERMETGDVADSVGISRATMTGVSKTLVSRGYVERTTTAEDRRLVHLSLSPAGVELMEHLYPRFNATEALLVDRLSPDELEGMTYALRRLVLSTQGQDTPQTR